MERTKPIPPMSEKRRAEFEARGIKHPTSTFLPPSPSSKPAPRRADTGPDRVTVDLIIERDASSCVVCGIGIDTTVGRGTLWSVHHRLRRGQHVDNRPATLALTCGSGTTRCHGEIHRDVANALKGGWLLKGTDEPDRVPMAHAMFGWVLLDNEGGMERTDLRPGGDI